MVHPTFEVHGKVGGYTGLGVNTAIVPKAEAKVSMRLVPNQDPAKIFRLVKNFIKKRNPDVQIIPESFLKPYLVRSPDHSPMRRETPCERLLGKSKHGCERVDPSAPLSQRRNTLKLRSVFWD